MRLFFLYIFLIFTLASCLVDEDYSMSPHDTLTFSVDSVDFDTLIAGDLAHTRTFQVYNNSKSSLRIPSISLQKGANSVFRVNVDGTALTNGMASDFEVRSGDSIRVFVNALPPSADSDIPVEHTDKLLFQLESGVVQMLDLTIHGLDVVKLEAVSIEANAAFTSKRPYQIIDSLVVRPGAELTLLPGTRMLFHPGASLIVYGKLNVQGSAEANVQFRGDRLGNMFTNQSYDRIPGQWGGIHIKSDSYGNVINFADIHSGNFGVLCDSCDVEAEKIRIENSILHNTSADALSLTNATALIGNSQITNAGGNCVTVHGGDVRMIHCTIGQFYAFTAGKGGALYFSNSSYPLQRLEVQNSIVTGSSSDEIMGVRGDDESVPFNYLFQNCLLNTPEYEAPELINCLWDTSDNAVYRADNFYPPFDLDRLLFTFYLASQSLAVGAADQSITQSTYPLDREGIAQPEQPNLGCYSKVVLTTE
jgi:hypothetical protein